MTLKYVFPLMVALAATLSTTYAADEDLPPVVEKKQSGYKYVSGGVGELGRKAMSKVANKYPLQLYFSIEGQADLTGVKVTVRDRMLKKQIEATSEGPLFFFTPDSGRWTVDAEFDGEIISKTVDLIGRRYILLEYRFKSAEAAAK